MSNTGEIFIDEHRKRLEVKLRREFGDNQCPVSAATQSEEVSSTSAASVGLVAALRAHEVFVIIAAFNEAECIADVVRNVREL